MAYIRFFNPFFTANRDENADSAYDQLVSRFNQNDCGCAPAANIYESDKEYQIEMALPGVNKNNIRIKHENEYLMVGVDKAENEPKEEKYTLQEFDYTGSSRVFKTGNKVNAENITAKYDNGVLHISLPKKEAHVSKPVQTIAVN